MATKSKKNNLVEIKPNKTLIAIKETNKVVATLIFLTGNLFLSLLVILLLLVNNNKLAKREKIFVQQSNGTIERALEEDKYFRSNKVIKSFVKNWLYLTWELDSELPDSEEYDQGVEIKYPGADEFTIPSRVYAASFAIEEGFREEFLQKFSELIPQQFYKGEFKSQLLIYNIGTPIRKNNKYEVQVTATRFDKTNTGEIGKVKFNKTIVLKAIEPYQLILGVDEKSAFRKYLKQFLKNGLIITSIDNHQ